MSGYIFHVVYTSIPTLSVLERRLQVTAIFQPSFLPEVPQLASMARSTSAASDAMDVNEEEEDFSCDYDLDVKGEESSCENDEEKQADVDMGSPHARACGEPLMGGGRKCRASMLLEFLDSDFRKNFENYTVAEAKKTYLQDPDDFRTAAMLQFLFRTGHEAFEKLHFGPG